jgi:sterol desaturase/sphingolipid hydroxylase (fatty acid hydroxylase superfamily)
MVSYWVPVFTFYILDYQCSDNIERLNLEYPKAIKTSLSNQLIITLPVFYLLKDFINNAALKASDDSICLSIGKTFLIINFANLLFYFSHRLLHTKILFAHIHHIHHEFRKPIGAATFYAHPIEHLFTNVLSFLIPVILVGVKYWILIMLLSFSTIMGVTAHSEHEILPVFLSGSEHLVHHESSHSNYGFGKYLDKLFDTYRIMNKN